MSTQLLAMVLAPLMGLFIVSIGNGFYHPSQHYDWTPPVPRPRWLVLFPRLILLA